MPTCGWFRTSSRWRCWRSVVQRPRRGWSMRWRIAVLAFAFWIVKVAATTVSLAIAGKPAGSASAGAGPCPDGRAGGVPGRAGLPRLSGRLPRNSTCGAMVIVRRYGFSNDQWVIEGANLLIVDFPASRLFRSRPVADGAAANAAAGPRAIRSIGRSRHFPRDAFDYVWLIDPPAFDPRFGRGPATWSGAARVASSIVSPVK